ncbi:hypothetical protein BCR33DRAFT_440992 [Rhizoclosmatium globosum]|uniref:Uncharacterized protein n=1 Tax=Rhizoclosmatium globosum TaxID=329046 RepID=A0A1Y2BUY0_9FUNG|nr:hypothetical protein BCR33DRAFT_440992 [Rhizoclosmatium globosum]|eukprot:ORY37915.1 hypothetical protein BCR33DRAFT_440992 [Rhizoclosmatium globosum]
MFILHGPRILMKIIRRVPVRRNQFDPPRKVRNGFRVHFDGRREGKGCGGVWTRIREPGVLQALEGCWTARGGLGEERRDEGLCERGESVYGWEETEKSFAERVYIDGSTVSRCFCYFGCLVDGIESEFASMHSFFHSHGGITLLPSCTHSFRSAHWFQLVL